jgi:membrane protease YdiL (CAAX protease family)
MKFVFKNRYNELRSGWAIAAATAIILIGQMTGRALVPDGKEDDIAVKVIVTLVYSPITIGGLLLLFKLLYKRSVRQMGLISEGWFSCFLYGIGMGAVSVGLLFVVLLVSAQVQVTGIDIVRLLTIRMPIEFASVCLFMFSEELFARGFLMTALKTTRNKWVILLSSSIIFGLAHLLNPEVGILSLVNMCLAGLLFAYMFVKSGKLWLPTGFHVAWNFISGDILGMMASEFQPASVVVTRIVGTNELLTGGIHGPDGGSLVVTVIILLALLYTHFFFNIPDSNVWTMESDLPLTRGN